MYNKIFEFCKVRNQGNIFKNGDTPTPRVQFILELLDSEGIEYELDTFAVIRHTPRPSPIFKRKKDTRRINIEEINKERNKPILGFNIIMKGNSNRMIVAHHDVANPNIDNANDNSASVINAIMVKKLMPEMNVILLDGEEYGGLGSKQAANQIIDGYFGKIDWVLNLELTGKGGKYFFIGDYPGKLTDHILSIFNCPIVHTPFNDSVIFRRYNIDSVVINPLPILLEGKSHVRWSDDIHLDYKILYNCHSKEDNLESIDINDMKEFVEDVLLKILKK